MSRAINISSISATPAWLIPLPGGIPLEPFELIPAKGKRVVVGRNKDCDLPLPIQAEEVSRKHADFFHQSGKWCIADLASRWGTFVNGIKIQPNRPIPLNEGDLVQIHPWTFRFSHEKKSTTRSAVVEGDDKTQIRTLIGPSGEPLQQDLLQLLIEASATIQAAEDESKLAAVLLDIALRGTGLAHAAMLRPLDAGNAFDVILTKSSFGDVPTAEMRFSRSLLSAASQGNIAEFSDAGSFDTSQSILQSNIAVAICAPLMLGKTVAAYLYLDSRGNSQRILRPNASGFCQALCRIAGLAMANHKRIDIERRAARLEFELSAASAAQAWILPRETITAGPFVCRGKSQSGGYLGGDFFDAQVLPDGRLAVSLGDVSGHDAAASVLMTAAQGFLHASLSHRGDLPHAIASLNTFIHARCAQEKFVTLWTGVFDPQQMSLTYIDAGHALAFLIKPDKTLQALDQGGGPPIGIDPASSYQVATVPLSPQDHVLVISDGIIEQFAADPAPDGQLHQFGRERAQSAIQSPRHPDDLLKSLFHALEAFAGGKNYSDDVTAILIQCQTNSA